jgi:diacylglycerol kinase family enzyme
MDRTLLLPVIGLTALGLVMVYSASAFLGADRFQSEYFFFQRHAVRVLIGLALLTLAALTAFAGPERRVDVAEVNGRILLNNVSLGIYASFVHDPTRKTRNRLLAFLRLAPAAFGRSRRPLRLAFEVEGRTEERETLVALIANNDYGGGSFSSLGARERLDEGLLHVYVLENVDRRTLLGLLGRAARGEAGGEGLLEWACRTLTVESSRPRVHAAVDGEPVVLDAPLEFELRPRALRVLVPA